MKKFYYILALLMGITGIVNLCLGEIEWFRHFCIMGLLFDIYAEVQKL